jgi:hypothetical protein
MPDENDSNTPSTDPERQPLSQGPVTPTAPHQNEYGEQAKSGTENKDNKTIRELEKDIRTGERWLIRIGAASVIMNVVIALIYFGQLKEMQRATRATQKSADAAKGTLGEIQEQSILMRQQLMGTMAAIVIFQGPRITNDPITNKQILVMQLSNRGHIISPEAHITFEVDTVSFPQLKMIRQPQSYAINVPQFGEAGWNKRYPLPDFSLQDTHFPTQRRTVTVRGKFGFNNGFGDEIPDQDFCFSYIGMYNARNEGGGSTSGGGGFIPCDEFKDLVSYISTHQLE